MVIYLGIAFVIAALACAFALQNRDPVTVAFLAWKAEAPLALILIATLAIGSLITLLALIPSAIREKWTTPLDDEPKKNDEPEKKDEPKNQKDSGGRDEPDSGEGGDQDREAGPGPS